MRRTTCTRLGLSLLLAAGTATLGLSGTASAVPDSGLTPVAYSAGLVTAMKRDLGLTDGQARTRLAQEDAAARLAPTAERAAGSAFGGSWFDPATGRLVVGLTSTAAAKAVHAAGADTVKVAHTLTSLDKVKAALDTRAQAGSVPAAVTGWHVDVRSSGVVVQVKAGAERDADVSAFLTVARKAGAVRIVQTAHTPQTLIGTAMGGDPWYNNNRDSQRCSVGFSVQGGFVSAGHCGIAGTDVYGANRTLMGKIERTSFPDNDYSFIRVNSQWFAAPYVRGPGTAANVVVRGSREAVIGSSICRSGSTTGWHCGLLLAKNETLNTIFGPIHELTRTNVCSEPGDSGGPFITGDQAQGMTSAGQGDCTSGGETWYQPVNEVLDAYGLTLLTVT